MASMRHVPGLVAVIVAVAEVLDKAHSEAVLPVLAIAKVTAPSPVPPEVVIDKAWEYGNALLVVVREVILKVDCETFEGVAEVAVEATPAIVLKARILTLYEVPLTRVEFVSLIVVITNGLAVLPVARSRQVAPSSVEY